MPPGWKSPLVFNACSVPRRWHSGENTQSFPNPPPGPHGKLCQALPSIPAQIPTSDHRQGGHSQLAPPAHHHAQIFLRFSYELLASSAA